MSMMCTPSKISKTSRMTLMTLAIGVSALALLAVAPPARAAFQVGNNARQFEFEGILRLYRVRVPASYDGSTEVPLVLDFHGLGSSSAQQQGISGMAQVSELEGFIVVYPNGVDAAWNAGLCCGNQGIDDVGFIRAVVAAIEAEANIDTRRVYATGLSNGGAITHRLACDAADLFAAAAPMAFPVPFRPLSECQPVRSIPVLTVMGLTDALVPYAGGLFPSAPDTFAYWHDINGCAAGEPDVLVESGQSRCETYTDCQNGVQAGLCSVVAQAFPNLPFDGHILYLNPDFNLASVAWSFLSQFQLPAVVPAPFHGVLEGEETMRLTGAGRATNAVEWDFTLANGTWAAEDATGTILSGSAQYSGPSGGRVTLTVTRDTEGRLLGSMGLLAADLTGAPEAPEVTSSKALTFKGTHARGRLRLHATLPIDAGDASGRYTLRLKGPIN